MTTSREAVLLDVVAEAERQREAHLLELRLERRDRAVELVVRARGGGSSSTTRRSGTGLARAVELASAHVAQPPSDRLRGLDVDDEQVLLEARRPRDHLARSRRARPSARRRRARPGRRRGCRRRRYELVSRARVTSISSRSSALPTWNGEAERLTMSCAPASARSVAGGPGCQTSSQIVIPTRASRRGGGGRGRDPRRSSGARRRRRSSGGSACGRRPARARPRRRRTRSRGRGRTRACRRARRSRRSRPRSPRATRARRARTRAAGGDPRADSRSSRARGRRRDRRRRRAPRRGRRGSAHGCRRGRRRRRSAARARFSGFRLTVTNRV